MAPSGVLERCKEALSSEGSRGVLVLRFTKRRRKLLGLRKGAHAHARS